MKKLTPETDAARHDLSDYGSPVLCSWGDWIPVDVACRLERERDEAREKAERYRLEANAMMMQRDEALMDRANGDIATMTINHYERILRERDEWKNKAYSHATDYTLMEAKCFRLEQQLKEYDQLKS